MANLFSNNLILRRGLRNPTITRPNLPSFPYHNGAKTAKSNEKLVNHKYATLFLSGMPFSRNMVESPFVIVIQ